MGAAVPSGILRRGDAADQLKITDPIFSLGFQVLGGPAATGADASEANDSQAIDVSDSVATLNFLFARTARLPSPYPDCGLGSTIDTLPVGSNIRVSSEGWSAPWESVSPAEQLRE